MPYAIKVGAFNVFICETVATNGHRVKVVKVNDFITIVAELN